MKSLANSKDSHPNGPLRPPEVAALVQKIVILASISLSGFGRSLQRAGAQVKVPLRGHASSRARETEADVLERAGIRNPDVVAAVTGLDEANLGSCSLARFEFGVPG